MADVHTKKQRSYNMSRIRGSDTKPEIAFRKALWAAGLRYTKTNKNIPGKPDVAFRGKKIAIFIDGCFWHKCPKHFKSPGNNAEFWETKITSNLSRDKKVNDILKLAGWKVIRIWEHEIKSDPVKAVEEIKKLMDK